MSEINIKVLKSRNKKEMPNVIKVSDNFQIMEVDIGDLIEGYMNGDDPDDISNLVEAMIISQKMPLK